MRRRLIALSTFGLIFLGMANVSADSSSTVTQSYSAQPSVLSGMLVELKSKSDNTVIPLATSDLSKMLGVVVPVNDSPIVLSTTTSTDQQVLVANSGQYNVLVSNQDGSIQSGDRLTISSLAGVAMKASSTQPEIIGIAESNFSGSANTLGSESVKTSTGKIINEKIGSVTVDVGLGVNPLYSKNSSKLPGFLTNPANELADKPVSVFHVLFATVTFLITIVVSASLLYGGARSRITAISRNPLAKSAIGRGLIIIVITVLVMTILGLLVSYLILKF